MDTDIEKIKRYILEDDTFSLFSTLENISEIICCLDEEHFTDNTMHRILEVFSINFYLFKCQHLDKGDKTRSTVSKDIRELKRFASYLHEIEIADNILEKHITDKKVWAAFAESLILLYL